MGFLQKFMGTKKRANKTTLKENYLQTDFWQKPGEYKNLVRKNGSNSNISGKI